MLTLEELHRWIGVTPFELFMHALALLVSSVFFGLKSTFLFTNQQIFIPLFIASGLNAYFHFIVFIRAVIEQRQFKNPLFLSIFNFMRVLMIITFEVLLCHKLEGDYEHREVSTYSFVFSPIYAAIALFGVQACKLD